tara:strand:+ start:1887 stop:2735 length:849 start_codon:yes stop_codon:yes gene_type:complete
MKRIYKKEDHFKRLTNYVRNNFDEGAILSSLISIAAKGGERSLTSDESIVLAALRRSAKKFEDASVEEIGEILNSYDDNQIPGLVNNVKGILFELEFVEIENSDGDSIFAYQFEQTNYPTYDVQLIDEQTGEIAEIQLKATNSASYVKSWMDEHGDNIVVTDEVAEELGLEGVGISNEELEVKVEDFLEKVKDVDEESLVPMLGNIGTISLAISLVFLVKKWMNGEIEKKEFLKTAALITGKKVVKFSIIAVALTIPGINFVTAVGLATNLIVQGKRTFDRI